MDHIVRSMQHTGSSRRGHKMSLSDGLQYYDKKRKLFIVCLFVCFSSNRSEEQELHDIV